MTGVLVAGALANKPANGGEAWVRMSWVAGLRDLGFDVSFVEELDSATCIDETGEPSPLHRSRNLVHWRQAVDFFDLDGCAALVCDGGRDVIGMSEADLTARAAEAALLVNISGHLTYQPVFQRVPRRAYVDLDPGYTQVWHAQGARLGLHDHDIHLTVGLDVGTSRCPLPTGGIRWRPIHRVTVLDDWPVASAGEPDRFTTVASWRGGYGRVTHDGRTFGLKAHEFRRFADLPARSPSVFEIALDIHPADAPDRQLLLERGWRLVDPRAATATPAAFREYVQGSGAEFSVAQGIYVEATTGWFSDRTARYLASGRPALVQDTGFSRHYPTGEGLVAFRTLEEAVAGAARIAADYERHSKAARALAEQFFDARTVLGTLLQDLEISP